MTIQLQIYQRLSYFISNLLTHEKKTHSKNKIGMYHLWKQKHIFTFAGLAAKLCPTLCDPMDCSLQGSSVPGIL